MKDNIPSGGPRGDPEKLVITQPEDFPQLWFTYYKGLLAYQELIKAEEGPEVFEAEKHYCLHELHGALSRIDKLHSRNLFVSVASDTSLPMEDRQTLQMIMIDALQGGEGEKAPGTESLLGAQSVETILAKGAKVPESDFRRSILPGLKEQAARYLATASMTLLSKN